MLRGKNYQARFGLSWKDLLNNSVESWKDELMSPSHKCAKRR